MKLQIKMGFKYITNFVKKFFTFFIQTDEISVERIKNESEPSKPINSYCKYDDLDCNKLLYVIENGVMEYECIYDNNGRLCIVLGENGRLEKFYQYDNRGRIVSNMERFDGELWELEHTIKYTYGKPVLGMLLSSRISERLPKPNYEDFINMTLDEQLDWCGDVCIAETHCYRTRNAMTEPWSDIDSHTINLNNCHDIMFNDIGRLPRVSVWG